jgi:ABC-type branched-subunit amino acid transport system substrate-binding protein
MTMLSKLPNQEVSRVITKKFIYSSAFLLMTTLLILSGCASSNTGAGTGSIKGGPGINLTAKTITLGILSPETGPVAQPIGIPIATGVKLFFDHVNANGGINGFKVNFVEEDSQYNPQIQVQKYNQIHNQVAMIADSLGTAPTVAINGLATSDQMLVSAATLSSELAREKYIILVGTPYRLQVENAFDYVVNKLGIKNPATGIIYQNDDYGQDGLTGYKESIAAYGLNNVGEASYATTDTDFTAQVSQMKAAGAKYVFLTTTPTITAGIIGTALKLGYSPQWIMQSPGFSTQLLGVPALVPALSKAWLVSQGSTWGDPSVPGEVQLTQDITKFDPTQKPDYYVEFGYAESEVTYAILKKAVAANDLSRAGLFNAFSSLGTVSLGGLYPSATYGSTPNQRVPTRDSIVYQIDPNSVGGVKAISPDFTGTAASHSQF